MELRFLPERGRRIFKTISVQTSIHQRNIQQGCKKIRIYPCCIPFDRSNGEGCLQRGETDKTWRQEPEALLQTSDSAI